MFGKKLPIMNTKKHTLQTVSFQQLEENIRDKGWYSEDFAVLYSNAQHAPRFGYPTRFDGYIICLLSSGSVSMSVDLKEYEVSKNSLIIVTPEHIVQTSRYSPDAESMIVLFSARFLGELHVEAQKAIPMILDYQPVLSLNEHEFEIMKDIYNALVRIVSSDNPYYKKEILCHFVSASFYKLCAMYRKYTTYETVRKSRAEEYFEKFIRLVVQYHKSEHGIGYYSDKLNITPKYLSSIVKTVSGRTAAQWIDAYIILEAKAMLRFSDKSIQEVAYALNFSSQSFFGKYFKQHTGLSPKQYRIQE